MKLLLTPERLAEIKERCDETMFLVDLRGDTRDALADIETLQLRVHELEEFIRNIDSGWDCDTGANGTHPTYCRSCSAREVLNKK